MLVTLRQRVKAVKQHAEREFIRMLADGDMGKAVDLQAHYIDLLAELLLIPWREA